MVKIIENNTIGKKSTQRIISDSTIVATDEIIVRCDPDYKEAYMYLEFSADDFATILPSASVTGTIDITVSENGVNYGTVTNGAAIDVSDPDYPRPNALGAISHVKAKASAGPGGSASHWRLIVARY